MISTCHGTTDRKLSANLHINLLKTQAYLTSFHNQVIVAKVAKVAKLQTLTRAHLDTPKPQPRTQALSSMRRRGDPSRKEPGYEVAKTSGSNSRDLS